VPDLERTHPPYTNDVEPVIRNVQSDVLGACLVSTSFELPVEVALHQRFRLTIETMHRAFSSAPGEAGEQDRTGHHQGVADNPRMFTQIQLWSSDRVSRSGRKRDECTRRDLTGCGLRITCARNGWLDHPGRWLMSACRRRRLFRLADRGEARLVGGGQDD